MILQISLIDALLKFLVFSKYASQPPSKMWKKWKFLFDLGLGVFDVENRDTVFTKNTLF